MDHLHNIFAGNDDDSHYESQPSPSFGSQSPESTLLDPATPISRRTSSTVFDYEKYNAVVDGTTKLAFGLNTPTSECGNPRQVQHSFSGAHSYPPFKCALFSSPYDYAKFKKESPKVKREPSSPCYEDEGKSSTAEGFPGAIIPNGAMCSPYGSFQHAEPSASIPLLRETPGGVSDEFVYSHQNLSDIVLTNPSYSFSDGPLSYDFDPTGMYLGANTHTFPTHMDLEPACPPPPPPYHDEDGRLGEGFLEKLSCFPRRRAQEHKKRAPQQIISVGSRSGVDVKVPVLGKGKYKCLHDDCEGKKFFKRPEHLKRHVTSIHCNIDPAACKFCPKSFNRPDNWLAHLKLHIPGHGGQNPNKKRTIQYAEAKPYYEAQMAIHKSRRGHKGRNTQKKKQWRLSIRLPSPTRYFYIVLGLLLFFVLLRFSVWSLASDL
ncbi:hypothetical protein GGS20DRAFT_562573 [Poronia punctata]|nr:hypothetical protein GGS20DRAFT_562573 [Poronia punctata]